MAPLTFNHSKHPIIEASDKVQVLTFIVTTAAITLDEVVAAIAIVVNGFYWYLLIPP